MKELNWSRDAGETSAPPLLIGGKYRLPHRRGESAKFDRLQDQLSVWIPSGPHTLFLKPRPVTLILVCKSRCKFRNSIQISPQSATYLLIACLHLLHHHNSSIKHHRTPTAPHISGSKMVTIPTMGPRQTNSLRQCNRPLITKLIRPTLKHLHPERPASTMTPNDQEPVRRAVGSR